VHVLYNDAMTNQKIFRRYIENLLSVLRGSDDPTDTAILKYLHKTCSGMEKKIQSKLIGRMGEAPSINWKHNVHPERVRKLIYDARVNKRKPGWARAVVLNAIGE
jgi:hypothetical protein